LRVEARVARQVLSYEQEARVARQVLSYEQEARVARERPCPSGAVYGQEAILPVSAPSPSGAAVRGKKVRLGIKKVLSYEQDRCSLILEFENHAVSSIKFYKIDYSRTPFSLELKSPRSKVVQVRRY
jgi:hypothetical protein